MSRHVICNGKNGQWTRGKGFDTFAPVGPWIDTDYDPDGKELTVTVNGDLRQQSNTSLLIHSVSKIIAHNGSIYDAGTR